MKKIVKKPDSDDRYKFELPSRMQAIRKNMRISQKEMAEKLGTSVTYISNIECGKTTIPAWLLDMYCKVLEVTPNDMLNFGIESESTAAEIADIVRLLPKEQQDAVKNIVDTLRDANINKC